MSIGVPDRPSGCGKTTLRAWPGWNSDGRRDPPDQKRGQQRHLSVPPELRRIAWCSQDCAVPGTWSVGRNVAFGIHQLPRPSRPRAVAEVLKRGAGRREHRYPHELSGGQQRRVALAARWRRARQLMLLDEPFSNLDVDLRRRWRTRCAHPENRWRTALFVTHDQFQRRLRLAM